MNILLAIAVGYVFGNIPPGYIVGRIFGKIDVRDHGSGGAGMTNVIRTVGRGAGLFVFVCDVLKAIAAFLLCAFWLGEGYSLLFGLYGGLGAVLGHNFPAVLKFRGGKGVACTLAIMLLVDWRAALIVFAAGVVIIAAARYISLGSLAMVTLFPALLYAFGQPAGIIWPAVALGLLCFVMHRGNIRRLATGTENPFTLKKKK